MLLVAKDGPAGRALLEVIQRGRMGVGELEGQDFGRRRLTCPVRRRAFEVHRLRHGAPEQPPRLRSPPPVSRGRERIIETAHGVKHVEAEAVR